MDFIMELPKVKLTVYRKQANLTQKQLAELVGCHKETIGRLERGTTLVGHNDLLERIATVLDKPVTTLMERLTWTTEP
jgi:transcriptional regulator with XRE-family HTH domain